MTRRWWLGIALSCALAAPANAQTAAPAPLSNVDAALAELAKGLADQSRPIPERLEIVKTLGGWATPQVLPILLGALKDPAPELRAAAARALGWAGNRDAIPALRERYEAPTEPNIVKAAALESLGIAGDRSLRPLFVPATKHSDAGIRQVGLWALALGPFTDPADRTQYLIQFAEDTALSGLLRCDAVRALFEVKEDRVVEAFIRILETEPRFAVAPPQGEGMQQQMMELRRLQARDVAAWVAEGLGQLRAKPATALLLKTAEDRSDYFLRLMSLRALILLGTPEARPIFLNRLNDPVAEIRVLGLIGLTHLGDKTAMSHVLGRLTDTSPLVRSQAVRTAAELGGAAVRPTLETLQRVDTDSNVQAVIDEVLAALPR